MPLPNAPRAVLIDLAGVLHIDDQAIPGAVDALKALRGLGLPLRFLTNTTRSPRGRIVSSLNKMGFDIDADEIQTAVLATRRLVEKRGLHPHYLVHPDIAGEIGTSHAEPDAVVIGDDLADDIGGAHAAGIPGILVRTGKFRPSDEHHPTHRPAAVVDDFAAAVALLTASS